ncbi:MAG TPA: hypothetical protein VJ984_11545 [Xanthomonadales bacterium]|nr:hypothetical protein [Xanthomonadales bacterium]
MGLFDLPAPLLAAADQVLASVLPVSVRLVLWGILCGWLTMLIYRRLSNQDSISELKSRQKEQQEAISRFDGDFSELMPLIRQTFSLGFRQLGLSIGPALLATIPILFIVAWVATAFIYVSPEPGAEINVVADPTTGQLTWSDGAQATTLETGWKITWPTDDETISLVFDSETQLDLSSEELHGVIHKRKWWNWLLANPAGYIPDDSQVDDVTIELPTMQFLSFGPGWMRGSLFVFFSAFLMASVAFKFLLKID